MSLSIGTIISFYSFRNYIYINRRTDGTYYGPCQYPCQWSLAWTQSLKNCALSCLCSALSCPSSHSPSLSELKTRMSQLFNSTLAPHETRTGPNILDPSFSGVNSNPSSTLNSTENTNCRCPPSCRNLVVCIDGTSNQFSAKNSNVVELYSRLEKNKEQLTYYDSGIGTYVKDSAGLRSWFSLDAWKQTVSHTIDMAIAWNFKSKVLSAYQWLSENYEDGDRIFLFGFSRGAYQVRVIAGMIHLVGLLHKGNNNQIPFAYELYMQSISGEKQAQDTMESSPFPTCDRFKNTFSSNANVHFVGVWDTVSSIGVLRGRSYPETTSGMGHVCAFRHALALDERRVKFLPEYASGDQGPATNDVAVKEVWFAGSHSDIGGGNTVNVDLDHFGPALRWMSCEAIFYGAKMRFDRPWKWELTKPTNSLTGFWNIFEYLPLSRLSYQSTNADPVRALHLGGPRQVQRNQLIHSSVFDLKEEMTYTGSARLHGDAKWDIHSLKRREMLEDDLFATTDKLLEALESPSKMTEKAISLLNALSSSDYGRCFILECSNVVNVCMLSLRAESSLAIPNPRRLSALIKITKIFLSPSVANRLCIVTVLQNIEVALGPSVYMVKDTLHECLNVLEQPSCQKLNSKDASELQHIADIHNQKASKIADPLLRAGHLDDLAAIFLLQLGSSREDDRDPLQEALKQHQEAVKLATDHGSDVQIHLTTYDKALQRQFTYLCNANDLANAIACARHACGLLDDNTASKHDWFRNLSITLRLRSDVNGDIQDIEGAVCSAQKAIDLLLKNHSNTPGALLVSASALQTRFVHLRNIEDIDQAIAKAKQANALITYDSTDTNKSSCLSVLSATLRNRFDYLRKPNDIEEALDFAQQAVELVRKARTNDPTPFYDLAMVLRSRFEYFGEAADVNNAMELELEAMRFIPSGHAHKSSRLHNLALILRSRFMWFGNVKNIGDAVSCAKEAIHLTPDDHASKPCKLNSLASIFRTRFERFGKMSDIDRAVLHARKAVDLTPDGHVNKPSRLESLALIFHTRFECFGKVIDIDQAIFYAQAAVDLTPDGHVDKYSRLNNLSLILLRRSDCSGEVSFIDKAIVLARQAVNLSPDIHPEKLYRPHDLVSAFSRHIKGFPMMEDLKVLAKMNDYVRQALELVPSNHPDRPSRLHGMALLLRCRFEYVGKAVKVEATAVKAAGIKAASIVAAGIKAAGIMAPGIDSEVAGAEAVVAGVDPEVVGVKVADIEDAIRSEQQAIDLTPDGHIDKPSMLHNMALIFRTRFEHSKEPADIDQAISLERRVVDLMPDGHADKPFMLHSVALNYRSRFELLGQRTDIDDAITWGGKALNLIPSSHASKIYLLWDMALNYRSRFARFRNVADRYKAIGLEQSVNSAKSNSLADGSRLYDIGWNLEWYFERFGEATMKAVMAMTTAETTKVTTAARRVPVETTKMLMVATAVTAAPDAHPIILSARAPSNLTSNSSPSKLSAIPMVPLMMCTSHSEVPIVLADTKRVTVCVPRADDVSPYSDSHAEKPSMRMFDNLMSISRSLFDHVKFMEEID